VDRGKERGSADALLVEDAIREGWIVVVKVSLPTEFARVCELAGVQRGEAEVIRHAGEKKIQALLDDRQARLVARSLRVPVKGSLGILVEGAKRGLLDKLEAEKKLDQLSDLMYVNSDLYRLIRKTIEES
jgi:predicted nucleic acid-binding protein